MGRAQVHVVVQARCELLDLLQGVVVVRGAACDVIAGRGAADDAKDVVVEGVALDIRGQGSIQGVRAPEGG